MRMFASDYLTEYPGEKDWVCVYDFGGSHNLLNHTVNLSAWWSPSRKIVAFGNNWHDVPDMPAASQPSERRIDTWEREHPGYLRRKINGIMARKKLRDVDSKSTERFYEKHGNGQVHAEFRLPDGEVKTIDEVCGIRSPMYMLPAAVGYMLEKLPPGTVLQKLTVSRRVPAHRGEHKLAA